MKREGTKNIEDALKTKNLVHEAYVPRVQAAGSPCENIDFKH